MSLINDMLNDLDTRRSQQQRQETSLDWMSGQKINRKKQWMLPLVISIAIVVLLVFGVGVWRFIQTADMAAVDKLTALNQYSKHQSSGKQSTKGLAVERSFSEEQVVPAPAVMAKADTPEAIVSSGEASAHKKGVLENGSQAGTAVATTTLVTTVTEPAEKVTIQTSQKKSAKEESNSPLIETAHKAQQRSSKTNQTAVAEKSADIKTDRPLSRVQQDVRQAKQAEMLIRDGRTVKAETELQDFLQQNPQAERSAELLASLWLSQQRIDEVETLLASLKTYNARSVGLQKIEARLLMLTGRHQQAVELLMTGHPAIELHADYYVLLGLAARQTQQYRLSAEAYSGLLAFDASQGDWWVGLAIALDLQEEFTAAREAYRRALELRKISPALRSYAEQRLQ